MGPTEQGVFPYLHIVDYGVVPCSSRVCDWLLSLSPGTISVDIDKKKKKCTRGSWNMRFPKGLFSSLPYPLSHSNGFCAERGKRSNLAANIRGPWQRESPFFSKIFSLFFWAKCYYGYEEVWGGEKKGEGRT